MKKCPFCGAQINDDSLFCTECGRPIPQGSVCPHCGASISDGDTFCQSCGKKVDESPSTDVADTIQKKCPYCGASVNDGNVFCENCGRNLADGNIGFTSNEVIPQTYETEENSSNKIFPIILGVLVVAIIGGGLWYWSSNNGNSKLTPSTNTIIQKGDSINEAITAVDPDSIEEVVDSIIDDGYIEQYAADTVATENYERYNDAEEDVSHCWYVYGTEKELQEQHIIENNKISNLSNFDRDYFTTVERNEKMVINLYSKNAEVLSNHPNDSYELMQDENGNYKLKIIEPIRFWEYTKYLVIEVK